MKSRLKQFRKALGYDQTEMGSVLNVKQSTYCFIETGRRKLMEKHIQLMVERCHLNRAWLETGNGAMFLEMEDKSKLVELYDRLCSENKVLLLKYAKLMSELEHKENS